MIILLGESARETESPGFGVSSTWFKISLVSVYDVANKKVSSPQVSSTFLLNAMVEKTEAILTVPNKVNAVIFLIRLEKIFANLFLPDTVSPPFIDDFLMETKNAML